METLQHMSFLREKINDIGTAIFSPESNSILKLPNAIVADVKADDFGYVWFAAPKQREEMQEVETTFPLRLSLYRKGMNCHMQVEAMGWIVYESEVDDHNQFGSTASAEPGKVFVKAKILRAEYYDIEAAAKAPVWKNSVQGLLQYLFGGNYQYQSKNVFYAS